MSKEKTPACTETGQADAGNTPPMPDTHCPSWCAKDHESQLQHFAITTADLGRGVIYGIGKSPSGELLVMNLDKHLAKIPMARNLMQRHA
jgi:hypothetical protein